MKLNHTETDSHCRRILMEMAFGIVDVLLWTYETGLFGVVDKNKWSVVTKYNT